MLARPLAGRLVRIVSFTRKVDPALVARAIDIDPSFQEKRGVDSPGHCYHACDIHHFGRLSHPAEAACERWGSILHNIFSDNQNTPPWRMACRLILREAGVTFCGAANDEEFISTVVDILEHADGRKRPAKPISRKALKAIAAGEDMPESETIRNLREGIGPGLRDLYGVRQTWGGAAPRSWLAVYTMLTTRRQTKTFGSDTDHSTSMQVVLRR